MTIAIPAQALADARAGAAAAGYPELVPVLLALAYPESGFDPGAVGDGGYSFGYLQFYTRGGLGDGVPPAELLDGPSNMRRGAAYIGDRLRQNGGDLRDALRPWSTRESALALLDEVRSAIAEPAPSVPGPTPAAAGAAGVLVLALFALGAIALIGG